MRLLSLTTTVAAVALSTAAHAAVLTNGDVSMGVADNAGLGADGVGFNLAGSGDAILRGCLCEGWGAAANGNGDSVYGLSGSGIVSAALSDVTGSSAKSTVVMSNGLTVTHTYTPVGSNTLFKIDIAITNTGAGTATDVRYARTLDWDVAPGFFGNNFTTIFVPGVAPEGPILHTSSDPFTTSDPMVLPGQEANTNITDSIGDKGSYFAFSFGDLEVGESANFTTYIGAALSVRALLAALAGVGVEAFSYTTDQNKETAYGYGFAGLGLPPIGEVPEPAVLGLFGLGLASVAAARRRRKA